MGYVELLHRVIMKSGLRKHYGEEAENCVEGRNGWDDL